MTQIPTEQEQAELAEFIDSNQSMPEEDLLDAIEKQFPQYSMQWLTDTMLSVLDIGT